jgi:hypothetical protein
VRFICFPELSNGSALTAAGCHRAWKTISATRRADHAAIPSDLWIQFRAEGGNQGGSDIG